MKTDRPSFLHADTTGKSQNLTYSKSAVILLFHEITQDLTTDLLRRIVKFRYLLYSSFFFMSGAESPSLKWLDCLEDFCNKVNRSLPVHWIQFVAVTCSFQHCRVFCFCFVCVWGKMVWVQTIIKHMLQWLPEWQPCHIRKWATIVAMGFLAHLIGFLQSLYNYCH